MFEPRGGLAQLGEHLLCKQGVVGSIPSTSTKTSNLNSFTLQCSGEEVKLFRFGRLRLMSCSFFNNLEEVKNLSEEANV